MNELDNPKDYEQDELINVKLARGDLEIIRNVIKREKAYNWLTAMLRTNWIWVIAGGILALWGLYDKINAYLIGVK